MGTLLQDVPALKQLLLHQYRTETPAKNHRSASVKSMSKPRRPIPRLLASNTLLFDVDVLKQQPNLLTVS